MHAGKRGTQMLQGPWRPGPGYQGSQLSGTGGAWEPAEPGLSLICLGLWAAHLSLRACFFLLVKTVLGFHCNSVV